ncbi:helix-turn-helix domain-containing protein [Rhodobacter capsulatus]
MITPTVRVSAPPPPEPAPEAAPEPEAPARDEAPLRTKTAQLSREELVRALDSAGWVQAKAARLLGMTPRQIAYALQKFEIELRKI